MYNSNCVSLQSIALRSVDIYAGMVRRMMVLEYEKPIIACNHWFLNFAIFVEYSPAFIVKK